MTHEKALMLILSNCCPSTEKDDEGFAEYELQLHCQTVVVTAKLYDENGEPKSEIKKVLII